MLAIDPEECIDCALCEPECPVNAIYAEDDVPSDQKEFIALNAELSQKWPTLTSMKPAPADAKSWEGVLNKRQYLEKEDSID
jgi:ferredoxin